MMVSTLTLRNAEYRGPTGRSALLNALLSLPASAITLSALPLSVIYYLLFRPKGFTLKTYLIIRFLRLFSLFQPILPPPEKVKARWDVPKTLGLHGLTEVKVTRVEVAPAPEAWRGAYASGPTCVVPAAMPGYVLTPPGVSSGQPRPGEKIIFYIHGGAYIRGHPLWTAFPHRLARDTGRRVFAAQYRKTLDDSTAFPAPLLDALAAWAYVTEELGFDPSSIVLSGDSAGAHLSLALCRQLDALGLPLPGGLALVSPWADFTCSFPSWEEHNLDMLTKGKLQKAIASATRHYAPEEIKGAFFSPALAPAGHWAFMSAVPVFVSLGGREAFTDEDEALVERMRADGVDVTLFKVSNGTGGDGANGRTNTGCTTRLSSTALSRPRAVRSRASLRASWIFSGSRRRASRRLAAAARRRAKKARRTRVMRARVCWSARPRRARSRV